MYRAIVADTQQMHQPKMTNSMGCVLSLPLIFRMRAKVTAQAIPEPMV
jgi:hypothetical protein